MTSSESRARAWVAHLRAGGVTRFSDFVGGPPESDIDHLAWVPGAQQLELLRQVNLAGRPSTELVEDLVTADLPLRGSLDLDLPGVGERGVDPVAVPDRELVRVAVGILARRAVSLGVPPGTAASTVDAARTKHAARLARRAWARLRSRRYRLAGDPVLVTGLRRQLAERGRPPTGRGRVIVIGSTVPRMLVDAWWHRVLQRGAPSWDVWQRGLRRRNRLPRSVDPLGIAGRWRARGAEVAVALNPAMVSRLTGVRRLVLPPGPDPAVTELARLVGAVLAVSVSPTERSRLLRVRVVPALRSACAPSGTHRLHPATYQWAVRQSERLHHQLRRDGYPVTGEPMSREDVSEGHELSPAHRGDVLQLAVAALLDEPTPTNAPGFRESRVESGLGGGS